MKSTHSTTTSTVTPLALAGRKRPADTDLVGNLLRRRLDKVDLEWGLYLAEIAVDSDAHLQSAA